MISMFIPRTFHVYVPAILAAFGIGVLVIAFVLLRVRLHRRARQFGYRSVRAYLRGVPRSDAEIQDSVDMAMRGLVLCILGAIFLPLILIGLFPLYHGVRKLALAWMGVKPATQDINSRPA